MTACDAADCAGDEEHHGDDDRLVGAEDRMHVFVENGAAKQHEGCGGAEDVAHEAGHDARALIAPKHHVEGEQKHEAQAQSLAVHLPQVVFVGRLYAKAHSWYTQCHPFPPSRGKRRLVRLMRLQAHVLCRQDST